MLKNIIDIENIITKGLNAKLLTTVFVGVELDWERLEEVVTRAVARARSEEMREMAEAMKLLASYMKEGFEKTFAILERHSKTLEEHSKILEEHTRILEEHTRLLEEHGKRLEEFGRRLEELTRVVGELKVAVGSLGRRWGRDLERTVLELYRHALEERGIEPGRVEKFIYTDVDGRFYRRGARIEVDVYIHDEKVYLVEVKSHAELEDVEWFYEKAGIAERILGRKAEKLIIVAVNIDKEALERARQLGIDAVYGAVIE
jgi:hypothetical protein